MNSNNALANFKDPALCRNLLDKIRAELDAPLSFMEVCGTHPVAIFPGRVVLQTSLGGQRLLDMLEGAQLPRIC